MNISDTGTVVQTASLGKDIFDFFLIIFLVALNGFFVAAEFAIVKVRSTQIQGLADRGNRRAKMSAKILGHLDAYLSATQLGITIASILLGAIGESFMRHRVVDPLLHDFTFISESTKNLISFFLGTGIIIFLHVVLGELAPKSIAIQKPNGTTLAIAYPLRMFYYLLYPGIVVLNGAANFILRIIGIHPAGGHEVSHSEEEIRMIVSESQKTGNLTRDKLDLLENVFDFSDVTVRQIMVPRTEVTAFDVRKTLGENLSIAEQTAHSRYPLVDGDLDNILGVIHMKDLFWQLKKLEMSPQQAAEAAERHNPVISGGNLSKTPPATGAQFLTAIARQILYVPETARINTLLREFQQQRIHMAVVIDEYGGTVGLVTFENVIEEIVGEVQDEFDQEAPRIKKENDNEYIVEGITPLDDINDELGIDLPTEDADTIGGFVLSQLGKFPKPGEKIPFGSIEITILELRKQRIHKVLLRFIEENTTETDNTESTSATQSDPEDDED